MANELYQALHAWSTTYRSDLGRMPTPITDQLLKVASLAVLVDEGFGSFIPPKQYPERYDLRRELAALERLLSARGVS